MPPADGLQDPLLPEPPAPEKLRIDDMLQKHCGEFGGWQIRHFVLTSLAWALEAFHTMVMIFADRQPSWRCVAPAGCPVADPGPAGVCSLAAGTWEWIGGPGMSTVTEWGLVCGERYKVGLVQAMFFAGCMIGAGVFGHLSDSALGRRGCLMVVCILNGVFGILTAFSPSYAFYAALRFLTGFSSGGLGLCAFVLATEPVGPSKRGIAGMSTFYFFSGGIAILSAIAYAFPSWRHLYLATSFPALLFVLLVIPFVSESPRWYLVRGKLTQALATMQSIAKSNGNHLPSHVTLATDDDTANKATYSSTDLLRTLSWSLTHKLDDDDQARTAVKGSTLIDVVRSAVTRRRLLLAVGINFLCSVVYYGLSLNVVNLGTNVYLNVGVNAVAEMPAFLITALLLDRFGRKPLTVGTLFFSGGFCLVGSLLTGARWKVAKMVCGVLGIFGMAGTYNLLFIYTAELFPTVVRNAALGCVTQAGQMGAILAPFVVVSGGRWPFVVFAACGLVAGGLAFRLPETLNRPLYDTMAGLEEGEGDDV